MSNENILRTVNYGIDAASVRGNEWGAAGVARNMRALKA